MIERALVLSPNRPYAQEFRARIQQQLGNEVTVDIETNPMRAMQLRAGGYGLIILDGELGAYDGLQMMLMLKSHAPSAIFVLVYDAANDMHRMQALQTGARLVLSRPADEVAWDAALDDLRSLVEPAEESAAQPLAEGGSGEAAPAEVIATECLSGNSTYVQVRRPDGVIGDVFVYQGEIFHAQCPGASGEKAVAEILAWAEQGPQLTTRELIHIPPRTIDTPWREVLDFTPEPPEPVVTEPPEELSKPNEMASEAPSFRTGELPEPPAHTELPQSGLPAQHMTRTGTLIEPGEGFNSDAVTAYWNIDLAGNLLGGRNVENAEDTARLTYHIYRLMAEASVALEIDYFDRLTLYGPQVQQELAADNIGVSHAVFDAEQTNQDERDRFVQWCYGQGV